MNWKSAIYPPPATTCLRKHTPALPLERPSQSLRSETVASSPATAPLPGSRAFDVVFARKSARNPDPRRCPDEPLCSRRVGCLIRDPSEDDLADERRDLRFGSDAFARLLFDEA